MVTPVNRTFAAAIALSALLTVGANAQDIYATGFEGPTFNAGNLNGQNGWTAVPLSGASVRNDGGAFEGTNYVELQPGTTAQRAMTSNADYVLLRAWHRGTGADTAEAPEDPAAAVIAFVSNDANTYSVRAWDGNAGAEEFLNLTDAPIANANWAKVTLALSYIDSRYSVGVTQGSSTQGASNLGFFDSSVTSLNGFRSATEVGSSLDAFRATESDGDFDNDGFADLADAGSGGDPFNAEVLPLAFADVNGDSAINMLDALQLFRENTAGFDINGDGTVDSADGALFYDWCVGKVSVIPPLTETN